MSVVPLEHVWLDDRGAAWIDDTNVKVVEIALHQLGHGLSAEEIFEQHDRRLSLAQIHAALVCYHDHQAEFDRQIAEQFKGYETLRKQTLESPLRRRLRSAGKRP